MAERVGRVEFLVDLDGSTLPRQARRLGERIGAEGGKSFGNSFTKQFENTFNSRMSGLGKEMSRNLSREGRLAGARFGDDFDRELQSRFRRMQTNLANILSDKDSFREFAKGFDSVGDAVERINRDLRTLNRNYIQFEDENGEVRESLVLTKDEMDRFSTAARLMGKELEGLNEKERVHNREVEDLEIKYRRLIRTIGDDKAFRAMADRVGGTNEAFRRLRSEIEGTGPALKRNRIELSEYVDKLEQTRDRVAVIIEREREQSLVRKQLGDDTDRLRKKQEEFGFSLRGLGERWKSLGHNARQWTLIIAAVMAAMQDLAVLSSAAGAGLFALGGGLGAAVGGIGGAVAIFTTLAKDLDELPPSMRKVKVEFEGLKGSLIGMRDAISETAFTQMDGTFARMSRTVKALNPSFRRLGGSVGFVFDELSHGLEEGTDGFEELQGFIDNAAEDFPALARAAGTWGESLLRAMNRANPMVDQMIGYIQELGDRFNEFTKSNAFDLWIRNSMETFKDFGELLDATSRALNDLVTPESIVRTQAFLDNLTEFMPNLSRLLDFLGRLDIFGVAAEMLNDFGRALEPLAEPMAHLADSLRGVASSLIDNFAKALEIVAAVTTPVVDGLSMIIDALPPAALDALTSSIVLATGALITFKGVQGLAGAASAMGIFSTQMDKAKGKVAGWAGSLKSGLGKAGAVGLALVGVAALVQAMDGLWREMSDVDQKFVDMVASGKSLEGAFRELGESSAWLTASKEVTDWSVALDMLNNDFLRFIGLPGTAAAESRHLADTLNELSVPMGRLAANDLPAAQEQFRAWADEIGASDQQVLAMLEHMPEFKSQLAASVEAQGGLANSASLVEAALGRELTTMGGLAAGLPVATDNSADLAWSLDDLALSALDSAAEVDALSMKILDFGQKNLDARAAERQFEEAIDSLTEAVKENGKALDDQGLEFDTSTEKGRANQAAVDRLAQATHLNAAAIREQTGDQKLANEAIDAGRKELIRVLEQLGITGQAAEDYADNLGLIPLDIETEVALKGAAAAEAELTRLARNRFTTITITTNDQSKGNRREVTPFARGGNVFGPTRALIGEAGPEAVVPLRRPLSQVDPSVRWLSAIAQGKTPAMASGGVVGGGRGGVIFEAGAIVVQGAEDPRRVAIEVANEIAEMVNS